MRIAFAESIGRLAETAKRFLDQTHLIAQNKAIAELQHATATTVSSTVSAAVSSGVGVGVGTVETNPAPEIASLSISSENAPVLNGVASESGTSALDGAASLAATSSLDLLATSAPVQVVDFPYDAKLKALHEQVQQKQLTQRIDVTTYSMCTFESIFLTN